MTTKFGMNTINDKSSIRVHVNKLNRLIKMEIDDHDMLDECTVYHTFRVAKSGM